MDAAPDTSARARIAQGFRHLSVDERAVLNRCFYRGWTTHQTAAALGLTDHAVKSALHDALWNLLAVSTIGADAQ